MRKSRNGLHEARESFTLEFFRGGGHVIAGNFSCPFLITGASERIGNMHGGKWVCPVIDGGTKKMISFCSIRTPVFTISLESDGHQRTE